MPIKKAALKALYQNKKKTLKNRRMKKQLRDLEKKLRKAVSSKDIEFLKGVLPKINKSFDKASKAGIIKKNTASRKKSRLTKLCSLLSSQQPNQ